MADAAADILGLYQRHAAAWDAARNRGGPLMEEGWLARFTAWLPEGGSVLDLGCGSGAPMATRLAARGFRITGIDSAPGMIQRATARLPGHEFLVADMRRLDLGRRFHGILAWDSFFHLQPDDQRAIFTIFAAHASPGAALMFTSGPAAGIAMGVFEGEPLYHASLDPEEYRNLLAAHGFAERAFVPNDASCGGHCIWLASRR